MHKIFILMKQLQKKQRGMALFLVMISLTLMAIVVGDLSYNETIRYKVALNERDALKAEALAEGGLNLARLFLIVQGKVQPYLTTFAGFGIPLSSYTLWEMMPLDTELFKSLVTGDLISSYGVDIDEALNKRKEEKDKKEEKKKEEAKQGSIIIAQKGLPFEPPDGGFGAFEGSFNVTIQDEESKISLRNWASSIDAQKRDATQKLLTALISPARYDDLFVGYGATGQRVDRASLIANIFDYIDIDGARVDSYGLATEWGRTSMGSSEKDPYAQTKGIVPKNAYFDSFEELRLVHGMTDGHMRAFSNALSIYGDEGKINILSAKDQVVEALVFFCAENKQDPLLLNSVYVDETVKGWKDYKEQGLGPVSPQGFVGYLKTRKISIDDKTCQSVLDVVSKNFKLISSATVNGVTRKLTLVTRVVNGVEEKYYFRNN